MLAAFATVTFLATLWMLAAIVLQMAGESGGKILAALRGRSLLATAPSVTPVVVRFSGRPRLQRPVRAEPQLRAAA